MQQPTYEVRISDWSSDVCSSDLQGRRGAVAAGAADLMADSGCAHDARFCTGAGAGGPGALSRGVDRKSVVQGKGVSVRVDLGGRRSSKTKKKTTICDSVVRNTRPKITNRHQYPYTHSK